MKATATAATDNTAKADEVEMRQVRLDFESDLGVLEVRGLPVDSDAAQAYWGRFTGADAKNFLDKRLEQIRDAFPGRTVKLGVNGQSILPI